MEFWPFYRNDSDLHSLKISIILSIRIRSWRKSLDQLIQTLHNKTRGID
jgi:hypothetical protein